MSKRNLKAVVYVLLMCCGALLVAVVSTWAIMAVMTRFAYRALEARLDELRRAGYLVDTADLLHPTVSEEESALYFLESVAEQLHRFEQDVYGLYLQESSEGVSADRENLENKMNAFWGLYETVHKAVGCRYLICPQKRAITLHDQTFDIWLTSLQLSRAACRYLQVYATLKIWRNDLAGATEATLDISRMARLCAQEPMLLYSLTALAELNVFMHTCNKLMETPGISMEHLSALDAELATWDVTKLAEHAFKSECAYGLNSILKVTCAYGCNVDGRGSGQTWHAWFPAPTWYNTALLYADMIELYCKRCTLPRYERVRLVSKEIPPRLFAAKVLVDSIRATAEQFEHAVDRSQALINCARVAICIKQQAIAGKVLQPIEKLGLPREVITDPYTGKPLLVHQEGKTVCVYSVGPNLEDNNGDIDTTAQDGSRNEPLDVGFRITLP